MSRENSQFAPASGSRRLDATNVDERVRVLPGVPPMKEVYVDVFKLAREQAKESLKILLELVRS
jgi:hypothetical protein